MTGAPIQQQPPSPTHALLQYNSTNSDTSRMRAHKGNVPSLPQTKYCSLCPAKFTRTTHLNRHLRSHTNERLHRCNLCHISEFTRSDLLTRHKRTCGQSVNRSRRKSCESCAESKIKCNLEYPCAKCTARGRECVFQNDPEESRNKSKASRKHSSSSSHSSAASTPSPKIPISSLPALAMVEEGSSRASSPPLSSSPSPVLSLPALSDAGSSASSSSSSEEGYYSYSSGRSSPRSDDFRTSFEERQAFGVDYSSAFPGGVGAFDEPGSALSSTISPYDDQSHHSFFPSSALLSSSSSFDGIAPSSKAAGNSITNEVALSLAADIDLFTSLIRSPLPHHHAPSPPPPPPPLSLSHPPDDVSVSISGNAATASTSNLLMSQPTVSLDYVSPLDMQGLFRGGASGSGAGGTEGGIAAGVAADVLDVYLHLFFTRFLSQVPIIHAPTWNMSSTHPLLTKAFYACGALFVPTPEAEAFVEVTMAEVGREVAQLYNATTTKSSTPTTTTPTDSELNTPTITPAAANANVLSGHQQHQDIDLILALVLLQTIQLFRRQGPSHHSPTDGQEGIAVAASQAQALNPQHHAMLVSLIRRTGLIQQVASWTAPEWIFSARVDDDENTLQAAWVGWTWFATAKRALLLAYIHDCSQCTYSPSASPNTPLGGGFGLFSTAELNVPLPCDDELWNASSAREWLSAAQVPSPYGVGVGRMYGVNMGSALAVLATPPTSNHNPSEPAIDHPVPSNIPLLTSFGLFVLIHTILRNISLGQRPRPSPTDNWSSSSLNFALGAHSQAGGSRTMTTESSFRTQVALDNWLQVWLRSPEAAASMGSTTMSAYGAEGNGVDASGGNVSFVCNSLPFYWLAQVTLWENSWSGPAFIGMGEGQSSVSGSAPSFLHAPDDSRMPISTSSL
ncbi:zinc finger protein klf1 [Favolaschia claudopus]|uniref:Zinc finger protein klf1 n=1 Tax=Favolaschia claudopus TaxID=2862362 RepID=A0AAW0A204_9AGAR